MNKELILLQLSKFEYRLEQWARTQTIFLNGAETFKLQDIHTQIFGQSFKSNCPACVEEALTRLWNWYNTERTPEAVIVTDEPEEEMPVIEEAGFIQTTEEQPKKRRTRKKK